MTDNAKLLVATAREAALDWGNQEVTPEHPLYAATEAEPGRGILAELGQDPDKVAAQMRTLSDTGRAGEPADRMKDPNRPIGSFLFLGPTGVGKTESAKAPAEAVFGDEDRLIRFDMSEFLNRIDDTIVFHRLDSAQIHSIVGLVLDGTRRLLRGVCGLPGPPMCAIIAVPSWDNQLFRRNPLRELYIG